MDKFFNSAYRGDPGAPHSGPDRFVNVWVGSVAFSVLSHFYPYLWQLTNQHNWHNRAMVYEQYHWKKAMAKKQPYNFKWNQMGKEVRESYHYNWPIYFP